MRTVTCSLVSPFKVKIILSQPYAQKLIVTLFFLFLVLLFIFPGPEDGYHLTVQKGLAIESRQKLILTSAINSYKERYGIYPSQDNKVLFGQLSGENKDGIVFLDKNYFTFNSKGECVSPFFDRPYLFVIGPTGVDIKGEN